MWLSAEGKSLPGVKAKEVRLTSMSNGETLTVEVQADAAVGVKLCVKDERKSGNGEGYQEGLV
jgi:hypothetical protein